MWMIELRAASHWPPLRFSTERVSCAPTTLPPRSMRSAWPPRFRKERNSMARKYFGTHGVRGRVGEHRTRVDFALRLASAAARVLAPNGGTVLIGKDTRLSGYMFEAALEAGFVACGGNVMLIGPLPTPGIAYLTRRFQCDFGIVISASHNLYDDNGIKFFDSEGGKLSDEIEEAIEAELDRGPITRSSVDLGRATRVDKSRRHYQEFCAESL